jgi:cell wall-associated NlpC family hydrolase
MKWTKDYVGIPFKDQGRTRTGCDCWGLVRLIYESELSIELPDYGEISASDLREVSKHITNSNAHEPWAVVDSPQVFDVVVMRFYGSKYVGHVGVVVDPLQKTLIHTERGHDSVIVRFDDFRIRHRLVGFRRHRFRV